MKKILSLLLLTLTIVSCEKTDDGEAPAITVPNPVELEQTVYADYTTGKSGVTFTTAGAWSSTINESTLVRAEKTSEPEWITIDPASGDKAGAYTVNISLSKNLTGVKRSATITISCGEEQITISVTQEATTEKGEKPDPGITDERVKKINGKVIEYVDNGYLFAKIGDENYQNKFNSETQWAYLSGDDSRYDGWYCYFSYGNNGRVSCTEYQYGNLSVNLKTNYQWEGDKLSAVYDIYYDEKSNAGMRLNIEYGDKEYDKGNVDINWLLANTVNPNASFMTPAASAIGIKSVPCKKLINRIVVTDLNGDKYSSTYTYRYEFNPERYITKIYEKATMKLDGFEQDERTVYTFEYE